MHAYAYKLIPGELESFTVTPLHNTVVDEGLLASHAGTRFCHRLDVMYLVIYLRIKALHLNK